MKIFSITKYIAIAFLLFQITNLRAQIQIVKTMQSGCVNDTQAFSLECDGCTIVSWNVSGPHTSFNVDDPGIWGFYWTAPGSYNVNCNFIYNGSSDSRSYLAVISNPVTPEVSLSRTPSTNPITFGQQVVFTASPVANGGPAPTYQWFLNNVEQGGQTSYEYVNSALQNGDQVFVRMFSNAACPAPSYDDSNPITVNVTYPISTTPVAQSVSIPYNTSTTLSASGAVSGQVYRWYDVPTGNGGYYEGLSYPTPILQNHKTYYVCIRNPSTSGESVRVPQTVTLIVPPPAIPTLSINTCGPRTLTRGTPPADVIWSWQGTNENGLYPGGTQPVLTLTQATGQKYYLRAKAANADIWSSSVGVSVTVDPVDIAVDVYQPQNSVVQATHSIKLSPGFKVPQGSQFIGRIVISQAECNDIYNWSEETLYDQNAQPISRSRVYATGMGQTMQNQSIDYKSGKVWVSQPLYDNLNTPSAGTLPAPILENDFIFKKKFVTNAATGQSYAASDFDQTSTLNNPNAVGSQPGTVGWYYSSNNNLEPMTPVTSYPYARDYTPPGPDPTTSKSASPGDQYKMGSSHEVESERQSITIELSHYFSLRHHFVESELPVTGYKYITTDPDDKKAVIFVDADGRTLASATLTGTSTYDNWSYSYYNDLGQLVASVAPKGVIIGNPNAPNFVTRYYYDHLGRLIETTSPDEGKSQFVYSTDGKIRFSQNEVQRTITPGKHPYPSFSYTNYDYLGRLIESGEYTSSPGSTAPYVFDAVTSSGASSILNIVDINIGQGVDIEILNSSNFIGISKKLDATRCSDHTYIKYDFQASDLPNTPPYSVQTNTLGQVTKTENAEAITWYSYDEFGQLIWTKQQINGLGSKTIDYSYDYFGNVTEVVYQKDVPTEDFYHYYEYDKNQSLTKVQTSRDGTAKTLEAAYYYYLHGPLKRVELGGNIQGIDYVYNIDGSLKLINHPDPNLDPGTDGISGANAGFVKDVFGEALDYHASDYTGAGLNEGTLTTAAPYTDKFSGMLKAVRWHSAVDSHVPRAYAFTYDNVNQLDNADWGNVTGTLNGGYGISPSGVQAYKEDIGSYDKNGNIEGLTRKNKAGLNIANYTYNYTTNSNKLEQITGSGNITYEYNLMGQMTKQTESPDTFNIKYNAYGLVSEIRNGTGKRVIIKYRYDDRGNRIVKTLYDRNVASNPEIKSTYYVYDAGGNVLATYEKISGTTQLIEVPVYAAGRVAVYKPLVATTFYEVSDHLGNVRGVIGKPETLIYTATLEDNGQAVYTNPRVQEMAYFKNLSSSSVTDTRFNKSPATTAVPTPANSAYLKWISGMVGQDAAQKSIGPSIGLKVEAGDKIDVEVYVKYKKKTTYSRSGIVGAMASILGGNFAGTAAGIDVLATSTQVFNNGASAAVAISGGAGAENTRPHAYVNALVYDRGFNVNNSLTKVERVPLTAGFDAGNEAFSNHQMLTISTITITEPGYIYIYVSNESENTEVWFDDLKITHQRSNVVAGADYYPFGLAMENREITREDYRYGYQGQFSEEDSVTDYNEFDLRFYDAKIGRWLDVDPEGQFVSPYLAMSNRPNSMIDKDGGMSSVAWFGVGAVVGGITAAYIAKENGASMRTTAGWGLIGGIGGGLIFAGLNNIGDFPKLTAEQLSKVETGVNKSSLIATVLISSGGGKKAGGRLGGHVAVGVGGIAYGFSNRPAPNDDKSILFGLTDKGTWHGEGIFGPSTALGRGDIRYDIPITGAQFMYLFDEVSKLTLNPPDYALLGKRCTAIAARVLRAGKVIGKGSRLHQESPFQFRRYMTRKFKKYKVYGD